MRAGVLTGLVVVALGVVILASTEGDRFVRIVQDTERTASERNTALNALARLDEPRAVALAQKYLMAPEPNLRLTAAWLTARGGKKGGEQSLIALAKDDGIPTGFRAMAVGRLGVLRSEAGKPVVRKIAQDLVDRLGAKERVDQGLLSSTLAALGEYRDGADGRLALDLYRGSGYQAAPRALGLIGSQSAREALEQGLNRTKNAGTHVELQLALSRLGDTGAQEFLRRMLLSAGDLKRSSEVIDLDQVDAASGLAADVALRDLGSHPGDEVFREALLDMLSRSPCRDCELAWGPLARIGIRGYEDRVIAIASRPGVPAVPALQALIYGGAEDAARRLGVRRGVQEDAEALIKMYRSGRGKSWFSETGSSVY